MGNEFFMPAGTVKRSKVSEEKGFTLVEILIAMAVFGIVSAMVVTVFDSFQKGYTSQQVTSDALQKARSALSYMTSEIKIAGLDPSASGKFKVRTASLTEFTYDFDTDPFDGAVNTVAANASERKTFIFQNNKLQIIENKVVSGAPSAGSAKTAEDLLSNINMNATATSPSRFEYLDRNDKPIPAPVSSGVASESLPEICSVRIFLSVKEPAGRSGDITKNLDTTVLCRNLQFMAYK